MKQWKLIQLRKENKMTQKDLAKILDIDVSTYCHKENGTNQFNANEMFILSEVFGKPMEDIFLRNDSILKGVTTVKSI